MQVRKNLDTARARGNILRAMSRIELAAKDLQSVYEPSESLAELISELELFCANLEMASERLLLAND